MSTDIGYIKQKREEELYITKFYGGTDRGTCIQLTQKSGFVQFSLEDYVTLKEVLDAFFYQNVNMEQLQKSEFIKEEEE